MPIATVRIAPVERWCEQTEYDSRNSLRDLIVGKEVQIDTASMTVAPGAFHACSGKNWLLTPKCQDEIDEILHSNLRGRAWWCEHLLEMD